MAGFGKRQMVYVEDKDPAAAICEGALMALSQLTSQNI